MYEWLEMLTRSQAIGVSATRRECEVVRYEVWDFRQIRRWISRQEENEMVESVFRRHGSRRVALIVNSSAKLRVQMRIDSGLIDWRCSGTAS